MSTETRLTLTRASLWAGLGAAAVAILSWALPILGAPSKAEAVELKTQAIEQRVHVLEEARAADRELLARIDENVKRLVRKDESQRP